MNVRQGFFSVRSKTSQFGAAAVEMAIVFPLLFSVTYATIVYGYVFYIQQSLNRMAEEAVRTAIRIDPTANGYENQLDQAVDLSVNASKTVAPIIGNQQITVSKAVNAGAPGGPLYTVTLQLPLAALASSGFATVNLPFIGGFPPLPVNLTATAVAKVN